MFGMVRIRTGAAWRHDPELRAALRRGVGPHRAAAARGVVDALALEVDGVDIAAGLAEGPLLPTLEALLRAVARIVGGASHATVTFPDGELELLLRRRGRAVLLTVLALTRPSRVLARAVEVELDALAPSRRASAPPDRGGATSRTAAGQASPRAAPRAPLGAGLLHVRARGRRRARRRVRGRPARPRLAPRARTGGRPRGRRLRARRDRRRPVPRAARSGRGGGRAAARRPAGRGAARARARPRGSGASARARGGPRVAN